MTPVLVVFHSHHCLLVLSVFLVTLFRKFEQNRISTLRIIVVVCNCLPFKYVSLTRICEVILYIYFTNVRTNQSCYIAIIITFFLNEKCLFLICYLSMK